MGKLTWEVINQEALTGQEERFKLTQVALDVNMKRCWKTKVVKGRKGKAGVRVQRNCREVRSKVEKLYLNNHQSKIRQSKKPRNRILTQSVLGNLNLSVKFSILSLPVPSNL